MSAEVPEFNDTPVPVAGRYAAKPVIVEAVELTKDNYFRVREWIEEHRGEGSVSEARDNIGGTWVDDGIFINSPEGPRRVRFGMHVVRDTTGQFHSLTAESFDERFAKPRTPKEITRDVQGSDDPQVWAAAFVELFPEAGVDEGTMIGWFANAMQNALDVRAKAAK